VSKKSDWNGSKIVVRLEAFLDEFEHGVFFGDGNHDFLPDGESALFEFFEE
jgi:hypothetical protein